MFNELILEVSPNDYDFLRNGSDRFSSSAYALIGVVDKIGTPFWWVTVFSRMFSSKDSLGFFLEFMSETSPVSLAAKILLGICLVVPATINTAYEVYEQEKQRKERMGSVNLINRETLEKFNNFLSEEFKKKSETS